MAAAVAESPVLALGIRVPARTSGGGRAFASNLVAALDNRGDCAVTVFRMGGPPAGGADREVRVDVSSNAVVRRLTASRSLGRHAVEHGIDVMICPGTEVEDLPGIPTVMWPLTVAPFEREALGRLGSTVLDRARWAALRIGILASAGRANGLVFSSHYARAVYISHRPALAEKPSTVLHPSGTLEASRTETREPSVPYLLFVSHLYPYKMAIELVEAFTLARHRGLRHELVLVGGHVDAGYSERLRTRIGDLGVEACVHLPGAVSGAPLAAWYAEADAFIFPSASENAGSDALLDAFSVGLPVLSSSMSSMQEICQGAARYFDPRSQEGLAQLLLDTLNNPTQLAAMATASRRRGSAFPTWDNTAQGLVDFCARFSADRRSASDRE